MENLTFEFAGGAKPLQAGVSYVVVGVVASSNLEVLAERKDLGGKCRFEVATTAANPISTDRRGIEPADIFRNAFRQ